MHPSGILRGQMPSAHREACVVQHAPALPPEIVLLEVKRAYQDAKECEKLVTAPWDWAPGGRLYEMHLRGSHRARMSMRGEEFPVEG